MGYNDLILADGPELFWDFDVEDESVTPAPANFGFAVGGSIQDDGAASIDDQLDACADMGAKWVRLDINWSQCEGTQGVYNWVSDYAIDGVISRGMEPLCGITGGCPLWARPAWTNGYSYGYRYRYSATDFANFCTAAVTHYQPRGVSYYEINNEMNLGWNWVTGAEPGTPQADPVSWSAILIAGYNAIKAVDSSAFVIPAGTSPAGTDGTDMSPYQWYASLYYLGCKDYMDAINHHPYTWSAHATGTQSWNSWYQMYGANPSLRTLMEAAGDSAKDIWATEYGAPTNGDPVQDHPLTEVQQAQWLGEAMDLWNSYSFAGPFFCYMHVDTGPANVQATREQHFGLMRSDYSRKPAADEFQSRAEAGNPGTVVLDSSGNGNDGQRFTNGNSSASGHIGGGFSLAVNDRSYPEGGRSTTTFAGWQYNYTGGTQVASQQSPGTGWRADSYKPYASGAKLSLEVLVRKTDDDSFATLFTGAGGGAAPGGTQAPHPTWEMGGADRRINLAYPNTAGVPTAATPMPTSTLSVFNRQSVNSNSNFRTLNNDRGIDTGFAFISTASGAYVDWRFEAEQNWVYNVSFWLWPTLTPTAMELRVMNSQGSAYGGATPAIATGPWQRLSYTFKASTSDLHYLRWQQRASAAAAGYMTGVLAEKRTSGASSPLAYFPKNSDLIPPQSGYPQIRWQGTAHESPAEQRVAGDMMRFYPNVNKFPVGWVDWGNTNTGHPNSTFELNENMHMVCQFDDTTGIAEWWLNGVSMGKQGPRGFFNEPLGYASRTQPGLDPGFFQFGFRGNFTDPNTEVYGGFVDKVAVYEYLLTQDQIKAHADAALYGLAPRYGTMKKAVRSVIRKIGPTYWLPLSSATPNAELVSETAVTCFGGIQYGQAASLIPGASDKATTFDGVDDYIALDASPSLSNTLVFHFFTFVNPFGSGTQTLLGTSGTTDVNFRIQALPNLLDGTSDLKVTNDGSSVTISDVLTDFKRHLWTVLYVPTFAGLVVCYIDGLQVGSGFLSGPTDFDANAGTFQIGTHAGGQDMFMGTMHLCLIDNGLPTGSDLRALALALNPTLK
jgi:hypothetical protein